MKRKKICLLVIVFLSLICILILGKKVGNMDDKNLTSEEMLAQAQNLLDNNGDSQKISDLCKAAIEKDEENPVGYILLAYLYSAEGNSQRALSYIEQGKSRMNDKMPKKELARCYLYMGLAYKDMWVFEGDRWNDAGIDCFYQTIDLDEGHEVTEAYYTYDAYNAILEICEGRGIRYNTKECVKIAEILNREEGGKYVSRLIELISLYLANGDYDKAKAGIETLRAEGVLTEFEEAWLHGKYYCFTGELEETDKCLKSMSISDNKADRKKFYLLNAYYEMVNNNPKGVKENIEQLLDEGIVNYKFGVVQEIIQTSGISIDPQYEEEWERYRDECSNISFD